VARPKAFDREQALLAAMQVFWVKGYEATSLEDLLAAMKIGRQSLYDTFGDKRALFLEALRAYRADSITATLKRLRTGPTALAAIERVLVELAEEPPKRRALGCMAVNAICELGKDDEGVRVATETSAVVLERSLIDIVEDGMAKGEIRRGIDARAAARFLAATLAGMKVQQKGGASPEALRDVAAFAVQSLRPR
jgi:TetR/AcrR family transcriptional regulator, transcriptional repressor for nem operon